MFRWFNDRRMRTKLFLAFFVMILLTGIVSLVAWISQERAHATVDRLLDVDVHKAELALETSEAVLMARRSEKDYLLRYEELGFEEAREQYVVQGVQAQVTIVRNNLAEIKRLEGHEKDIARVEDMDQAIVEYESTFLDTVDLLEQRGYTDTGLEGQFRDKVHEMESAIDVQCAQLMVDMLTMRR